MRKFLKIILYLPVAVVLLLLAVANRAPVTLSLDPLSPIDPAFFLRAPLFIYIFVALILGVLIGGMGTWFGQGRHRKAARQLRQETSRLKADMAEAKASSEAGAKAVAIR